MNYSVNSTLDVSTFLVFLLAPTNKTQGTHYTDRRLRKAKDKEFQFIQFGVGYP